MNSLTTIRDLVYQGRFTEALRIALNNSDDYIGISYTNQHSKSIKSYRKNYWGSDYKGDGYVLLIVSDRRLCATGNPYLFDTNIDQRRYREDGLGEKTGRGNFSLINEPGDGNFMYQDCYERTCFTEKNRWSMI